MKRKLRDNKKSLNATGGGPFAQKPLNDLEERVANFCNLHLTFVGNSGNCHGLKNNTINNENPPPEPSIHIPQQSGSDKSTQDGIIYIEETYEIEPVSNNTAKKKN